MAVRDLAKRRVTHRAYYLRNKAKILAARLATYIRNRAKNSLSYHPANLKSKDETIAKRKMRVNAYWRNASANLADRWVRRVVWARIQRMIGPNNILKPADIPQQWIGVIREALRTRRLAFGENWPRSGGITDRTLEERKARVRAAHQRWRQRNKEKLKEKSARQRFARKTNGDSYYKLHRDKMALRDKNYRANHPDRLYGNSPKAVATLQDGYVRFSIARRARIPQRTIPQEIVDLGRINLRLNRLMKKPKQAQ